MENTNDMTGIISDRWINPVDWFYCNYGCQWRINVGVIMLIYFVQLFPIIKNTDGSPTHTRVKVLQIKKIFINNFYKQNFYK